MVTMIRTFVNAKAMANGTDWSNRTNAPIARGTATTNSTAHSNILLSFSVDFSIPAIQSMQYCTWEDETYGHRFVASFYKLVCALGYRQEQYDDYQTTIPIYICFVTLAVSAFSFLVGVLLKLLFQFNM